MTTIPPSYEELLASFEGATEAMEWPMPRLKWHAILITSNRTDKETAKVLRTELERSDGTLSQAFIMLESLLADNVRLSARITALEKLADSWNESNDGPAMSFAHELYVALGVLEK